jgi:5-methylcytosine-specific restriction protein A
MAKRNPTWTRDELILALDLYFKCPPWTVNEKHPEIIALSKLLNGLAIHLLRPNAETFRNPNGVHKKMFNLQWWDKTHPGGLSNGSKLDKIIFEEFVDDKEHLSALAQAIRSQAESNTPLIIAPSLEEIDEESKAPEGAVLLRQHKTRERNSSLVKKKKALVLKQKGCLRCEACDFVYSEKYGEIGDGFIECHHNIPLSKLAPGQTTYLKDLALVCANCHRMLHRGGEVMTIKKLREIIYST